MKTNTTVREITFDELVNLFSTALYGNARWDIDYNDEKYRDQTLDDSVAKALLGGDTVFIYDNYADMEAYGSLPSHVEDDGSVRYNVALCDIMLAVEKIMDGSDCHMKKIVAEWADPDGDMDAYEADELLQFITFGEVIYG